MTATLPVQQVARADRNTRVLRLLRPPAKGELRVMHDGVTWQDYLALENEREKRGGFRVAYLNGTVEIMFPSFEHEIRKSNVSRLLEAYFDHLDVNYTVHGSTTLRSEIKEAGKEPDESYAFGDERKSRPDLAIEVAITSGGIDTLEIYRRHAVPEVWVWQKGELLVFVLDGEHYTQAARSRWFESLDIALLVECAQIENTSRARKRFIAALQGAQS